MAVKKRLISGTKGKSHKEISAEPIRKSGNDAVKLGRIAPLEVSGFKLSASRRASKVAAQTIEQRLEAKARVADTKVFATRSLGQMTREERRKLLFG